MSQSVTPAAAAPRPEVPTYSAAQAKRILIVTVGAIFLTIMNASMVQVALPPMMDAFDVPIAWATWIQTAYLVPYAVVLPLLGRAGDLYGHRRVMVIGTVVFLVASLACALSPNFFLLLIGRAVQALGSAALMPNGMAVISNVFPREKRGQALGLWSAAGSAGVIAGPTVGGLLVTQIGWPGIFLVNLPFGIIIALAMWRGLPARIGRPGTGGFDLAGALIFGAGLTVALFGVTEWRFAGLTPLTGGALIGGVVLLASFLWWEVRQTHPVIALSLFRIRAFDLLVTTDSLRALAMFSSNLMLPLYFQHVLGWSALTSGLMLIPYSLTMIVLSPVGGILADRIGAKPVTGLGLILLGLAMVIYSNLALVPLYPLIFTSLILCGAAQGLCQSPLTSSVMNVSPSDRFASASGLFNMFRFISGVIGTTAVGLLLGLRTDAGLAAGLSEPAALLDGMHFVFLLTAVSTGLALAALFWVGPIRRPVAAPRATQPRPAQ